MFLGFRFKYFSCLQRSIKKYFYWIGFSVLPAMCAFAVTGPQLKEHTKIVPGCSTEVYKYQFENGLTLLVLSDKRNPLALMHFILDAGSNREHAGATGLAHFFEHMMFRKTKTTPDGFYDRTLKFFGGRGNAGTNDSFVTYNAFFPVPALEHVLQFESQRFLGLELVEPYFSTEKGAVISERKLRIENNPQQRGFEVLRAVTERQTPLEWMTIGSKQDVENLRKEDAQRFYENFYAPNNTLMVVGSSFDHKKVATLVQKYFGNWKAQKIPPHFALPENYFTRDVGQHFICSEAVLTKKYRIVYPNPHFDQKDIVYSYIFQAMLDDNSQGTFVRRLLKDKLATDFQFHKVYWQRDTNPLIASFSLSQEQNFDIIENFWKKEVAQVLKKSLSEKIKGQILKQIAISNAKISERMSNLADTALENEFFLKDLGASLKMEQIVQSATTKSVRQWITDNLGAHQFYVTGIVPPGGAPSCTEFLAQFQKKSSSQK
jgi:predicted Zn-dependent peptidase